MNLASDCPVKSMYQELLKLTRECHNTWCTNVAKLMRSIGYGEVWDLQNIPPSESDIGSIKRALKLATVQRYKDKWENDVKDTIKYPVLRTYTKFKNSFSVEPYLNLVNVPKYRLAISQLRVSSHRLAIETGRHTRPPILASERICKYCHLQNIDDELHFITECDYHATERDNLYQTVQRYVPNFIAKDNHDRFVDILTSPDGDVLRTLGTYVFNGFKKRNASVL